MVQQLRQHPPPDRIRLLLCRTGQQPGEGIRRAVNGGTILPLQLRQFSQAALHQPVKVRPQAGGLAVAAAEKQGGQPVFQAPEEAVIRHAVTQLPPGQDDAEVRRRIQRRVFLPAGAAPDGMHWAAMASAGKAAAAVQQNGQKGQIVVQNHPGRQAVPPSQRAAQAAVGAAEQVCLLLSQPIRRRTHIAEHQNSRTTV